MAIPKKEHINDYAKTDAHLYGFDGTQWVGANVDVDGRLSTGLYAWDPDTLAFVPLQSTTDGMILTAPATYATAIYEDGASTYICKAALGSALNAAVWQISLLDEGAVPVQILWCDGNANFDNTATDLATVQGHSYL